jgi:hypothetical protein
MKKFAWKIEYSLTAVFIFAAVLFLIPTSFSSKEAAYISKWNENYNKVEYMFTAMSAQLDSEIVKELKDETDNDRREDLMIKLIQPYLRLTETEYPKWRYNPHYMNGKSISKNDLVYFDTWYKSQSGQIVGIKDVDYSNEYLPAFIMSDDVNGTKGPNLWGRDIYGVAIFKDGTVKALGYDKTIEELRKDCSESGTGVYCSHFYRIGGEFNE